MPTANNDLFSIKNITHADGVITAQLGINKESDILKGHFPGQPVVPGACMLQIVKDVLEAALAHPIRLKKADHLKFMTMIEPANTQRVQLDITYKNAEGDILVTAKLSNDELVYFKLQGSFERLSP
jgi:3-hydroxyacyl-[acyl-carrier-protein] dehydratase